MATKNKVENVTFGKPKVSGAIYTAPIGTKLPTSASEELDAAFLNLGYVSEDGVKNSVEIDSEGVKAWGGDNVATAFNGKTDQFSYTLIEALRPEVLEEVYGSENVSGTLETGIEVKSNPLEPEEHAIVIDQIFRGGVLSRHVIPRAKLTAIDEITYADSDLVGYGLTMDAFPDEEGNTHYQYMVKKAASATA